MRVFDTMENVDIHEKERESCGRVKVSLILFNPMDVIRRSGGGEYRSFSLYNNIGRLSEGSTVSVQIPFGLTTLYF